MGSPQEPTAEQYKELEEAGKLMMLHKPVRIKMKEGELTMKFNLPRQGVSLLRLEW